MVESNNAVQLQSTLMSNLNEQSKLKREYVNELRECCTGSTREKNKQAKERIANYKKQKVNENATNNPNADDNFDEEEDYVESQESLIGEIIETEEQIKTLREQLSAAKEKVNKYVTSKSK